MKTHEVVNDLGIVWKIIKCTFHFTWTFSFQQFPSVQFSVLEVGLKFFDTHCSYHDSDKCFIVTKGENITTNDVSLKVGQSTVSHQKKQIPDLSVTWCTVLKMVLRLLLLGPLIVML